MNYTLTLTDLADEEVRQAVLAPLAKYNASQAGPIQGRPIAALVKDDAGAVIGGLWGYTGYEWLFTQRLVVPAALRGRGVGTEIMHIGRDRRACRSGESQEREGADEPRVRLPLARRKLSGLLRLRWHGSHCHYRRGQETR